MKTESHHFAEYVSPGHPDRLADAIAEGIVDHAVGQDERALVGVEVAVHTDQVFVDGRVAWNHPDKERLPLKEIVQNVYENAGYNHVFSPAPQSLKISTDLCEGGLSDEESQLRSVSDDQNVVIGYAAKDGSTGHLPVAHWVAHRIGRALVQWRREGQIHTPEFAGPVHQLLGPDFKVLPHLRRFVDSSGSESWHWERLTLSIQHMEGLYYEPQHRILKAPLQRICQELEKETGISGLGDGDRHLFLNGAGDFHQGGPHGDNGLSGKKIVVDHYGPEIPIGGGALTGKDPHKIDRVGPLRARQWARQLARSHGKDACVRLVWSPGDAAPHHIDATLDPLGRRTELSPKQLPPRDWFAIETVFRDLNLGEVPWSKVLENGCFAEATHPWER